MPQLLLLGAHARMNAEQQEELEVLQSIFPDAITVITDSPPTWQLLIDSEMITVSLTTGLPDEYPNVLPEIQLDCTRGKYPEMAKLKAEVQEEAERGLGMAMIFTLATLIEQKLGDYVAVVKAADKKTHAKPVESYNEIRKFEGTPVTEERFNEWNAKFLKEMYAKKEAEEKRRLELLGNKLTGRQLFEQNKVTASSDTAFYDESGLNIDEAVFDGLEDLDLSDDGEDAEEA